MKEILINNIDKAGLILNIIGTLMVAFAFGKIKDCSIHTSDEKGNRIDFSYLLRPCMFKVGIAILLTGFILQFID
ncbi:MAG: hypothetical protein WC924_03150 [Candidatus Gracilibacteria bacterium]